MAKNLSSHRKIIVILGPTASGKSDLAVKIALRLNSKQTKRIRGISGAEVISADSRQVYKGMDIGSGKITKKEMKGVPHHLLGVVSPKKTFTAAQFQKMAKKAVEKILKGKKVPIVCGGTGLYIDALIYNYQFPKIPPQAELRKKLEKFPTEKLFEQLTNLDPKRAKNIDRHNRRRLIRAIEIAKNLGRVPELKKYSDYEVLKIGIKKSPGELEKLIEERLKKRLKIGMVKEVERLRDGSGLNPAGKPSASYGLNWKRLDGFGLEYRFISRYLRGLITKKEMEESIIKEGRHYAKRQMTWFKKDKRINWVDNAKAATKLVETFLK